MMLQVVASHRHRVGGAVEDPEVEGEEDPDAQGEGGVEPPVLGEGKQQFGRRHDREGDHGADHY